MEFVWFMVSAAWKILLIIFGFKAFKWILGDGKSVIKEMLHTIGSGIKAGCALLQIKLSLLTKKEETHDSIEVDGTSVRYLTQKEFEDIIREKNSFKPD